MMSSTFATILRLQISAVSRIKQRVLRIGSDVVLISHAHLPHSKLPATIYPGTSSRPTGVARRTRRDLVNTLSEPSAESTARVRGIS
jgi:hypothetical protein